MEQGGDVLPVSLRCLFSFEPQSPDPHGSEGSGHRGDGDSAWRAREGFVDKGISELGLEG